MLTHNIRECDLPYQRHMSPNSRWSNVWQATPFPPRLASQTSVRGMLTILRLTNPRGGHMLHNIVWCHCVQLVLHLGVNRGIRTISPPYATGASLFLIPTLTQETFSSHKTFMFCWPIMKIFWCILAIYVSPIERLYICRNKWRGSH